MNLSQKSARQWESASKAIHHISQSTDVVRNLPDMSERDPWGLLIFKQHEIST
jgi:hypothetical protein